MISKALLKRGGCCDLPTPVDLIRHLGITQGLFASTSDLLSHHSFGGTQVHTKELHPWFPNSDPLISNFWSMSTSACLVIHKMIITKIEVKKVRLIINQSYFLVIPQWCLTFTSLRCVHIPHCDSSLTEQGFYFTQLGVQSPVQRKRLMLQ